MSGEHPVLPRKPGVVADGDHCIVCGERAHFDHMEYYERQHWDPKRQLMSASMRLKKGWHEVCWQCAEKDPTPEDDRWEVDETACTRREWHRRRGAGRSAGPLIGYDGSIIESAKADPRVVGRV